MQAGPVIRRIAILAAVSVPSRTPSVPGVVPAGECAVPHQRTHPLADCGLNVHTHMVEWKTSSTYAQ